MRIALLLAAFAAVLTAASLANGNDGGVRSGVAALLRRSADAWNRGDLAAFMSCYENSPRTVYVSSTATVHGYAAIRAHYASRYRPGRMGVLSVSDLEVRPLGPQYAFATARWHLVRPAAEGPDASGLFSLVLHRTASGWVIVADHTP